MVLAFLVGLVIGAWCRLKGWVWLLATGAGYKGCKLPLSGSWILSFFPSPVPPVWGSRYTKGFWGEERLRAR